MILITSTSEFLLYFIVIFFFSFNSYRTVFGVVLCCPVFAARIHVPVGLNCEQMEHQHEEQYSHERNPRAYMSMRDYRDQWTGTPSYSVTPTYAPPPHPQYASLSQPQPLQPISPVEQVFLDLTKLVGDVVEGQRKFNSQLNQRICTVESSLNKRLDVLQSDLEKNN